MSLIASISGIRGTIGGRVGENLTPIDIVKFTAAYATNLKGKGLNNRVVIGRDARVSGKMVSALVASTLMSVGMDVIDLELTTTPTVEIAVPLENAAGGIIITASHNPANWNALKLLNEKGEFISAEEGEKILQLYNHQDFDFTNVENLGTFNLNNTYLQKHIDLILGLELVDKEAIAKQNFKVAIDCVNSTGGIYVPALLKALGVNHIAELNVIPNGHFPHNPEPLKENLTEICEYLKNNELDLGIVVDPDVDRLVFVCENGELFGEEYTLVAVADYILQHQKGATVSNLSSSRALRVITEKANCQYHSASVGEVNVVAKMKEINAVIGGEGNGGIIYPKLHYGRDALVGIALFLTHLVN